MHTLRHGNSVTEEVVFGGKVRVHSEHADLGNYELASTVPNLGSSIFTSERVIKKMDIRKNVTGKIWVVQS